MKILLDENIDVRLKNCFADPRVFTIKDMHCNGIMNGDLLLLLKENHFDAWIVVDKIFLISRMYLLSHAS